MVAIKKALAQVLFWIYDFIDTIGSVFNILTGTQHVTENKKTLLEVLIDSAVSTKVLLSLCVVSIIIVGVCMGVKIIKNTFKLKSGGEPTSSHAATVGQGFAAILATAICIFCTFLFIAFASMLLNAVSNAMVGGEQMTLGQNLFSLSVGESYVYEDEPVQREVGIYYDESGNPVQEMDENGLVWEKNDDGSFSLDENGMKKPVWVKQYEWYRPYKYDENGEIKVRTGWCDALDSKGEQIWVTNDKGEAVPKQYSAADLDWSMKPGKVFGVRAKSFYGLYETETGFYTQKPMVELDSFNLFTAYLGAIVIVISMFLLAVGLVKRMYDIVVLMICMPLVCGTIPLDDGARFRAWRETFMSKILVAFGAVIAINVFYLIGGFITGPQFGGVITYLTEQEVLSSMAATIFKLLLLLGGALCINGSQVLIARLMGTSADEGRESMQTLAVITSGVRMGTAGVLTAGRMATGVGRFTFGGTNRYGRHSVGLVPRLFRGVDAIGRKAGGENYESSKGGAFVRALGRMGGKYYGGHGYDNSKRTENNSGGFMQPNAIGSISGYSGNDRNSSIGNVIARGSDMGTDRRNSGGYKGGSKTNSNGKNNTKKQ